MNAFRFALPFLLASTASGPASAQYPIDPVVRYPHYHATYRVNADGTAVETHEWSQTVLKESALEGVKNAAVTYSTSAQTAAVKVAYTKKASGKRIDVPKNNYQVEINKGRDGDSPVYSDMTTMSVVFPDVAVGDTVVFGYEIVTKDPLFPGHFSETASFSTEDAYDEVRLRLDYPASLWLQHHASGMTPAGETEKKGRRVLEWTWANPRPLKNERRNYSVTDPDPQVGYSFSTFKAYEQIATAYGLRALPKAAVTPRVRQLAGEIAGKAASPREEAQLLYEWVARNITYAGNCIGIGAVVPRDLPVVLDNKIGDCKDHATLLQALLAARGIPSVQALINAGSEYRLPKVPVVSSVNHVINYIPSLELYVDSTSETTPFGLLPYGDQGKPVLHVEQFAEGTRTPVAPPDATRKHVKATMKLEATGALSGSVETVEHGAPAVATRAWARNLTADVERELVRNIFRRRGVVGSGEIRKDDPTALTDHYRYTMTFAQEKFVKLPGAGGFHVVPPIGPGSSVGTLLQFTGEVEKVDVACRSGSAAEEYSIEFPPGLQVLAIPDDVDVSNELLTYTARYKLKGRVLSVHRQLADRTPGNVCSPELVARYKQAGDLILEDLKAQVLYKLPRKKG